MVRQWINNLLGKREFQSDAFEVSSGGQKLVDPLLTLNAKIFHAGLRQQDKLNLYHSIYYSMPLATGAVNVIVKMINNRIIPKSGNPAVDQRMREIWQELNLHAVNDQLLRQALIYGFAVAEWVSEDGMQTIDRVVVPDSPLMRFVPNRQGTIDFVQQLAGSIYAPNDPRRNIPAGKFIILRRDPVSQFDYYGSSLFESAVQQYESLCKILDAQISVYMRLGKPRFVVTIPSEGLTPEQFQDRLAKAKTHFEKLSTSTATDLYMPSGVEVKIIGSESFGQRFADETRLVIQNILAAVGIPPALLHVTIQGGGGAESYLRQAVIAMQSMLDTVIEQVSQSWNSSFWRIIQRLERMPIAPVMTFERPRLLEQLMEEKGREAKWTNDVREVVAGIRPAEWLAIRCGANEIDDPTALNDYIDQQRQSPDQLEVKGNDSTNSNSQTKSTDERATNAGAAA